MQLILAMVRYKESMQVFKKCNPKRKKEETEIKQFTKKINANCKKD